MSRPSVSSSPALRRRSVGRGVVVLAFGQYPTDVLSRAVLPDGVRARICLSETEAWRIRSYAVHGTLRRTLALESRPGEQRSVLRYEERRRFLVSRQIRDRDDHPPEFERAVVRAPVTVIRRISRRSSGDRSGL